MARLRYRWLLPLGHALVDVIVLSHFIWQGYNQWWRSDEHPCSQPHYVLTAIWDGRPWDYDFLAVGTLPAALIAHAARPKARWQNCDRLWDPVWFSIHEAIALLLWFLVGMRLDSPGAPLRKLLGVYLGLRLAFALLCWLLAMPLLGPVLEMLFWLTFSVCALVYGCRWLLPRIRVHV